MLSIDFYPPAFLPDRKPKFAVIAAQYQNQWLLVRHKERSTWEIPGGHREEEEMIDDTARRELYEETGATQFELTPVCYYSVTIEGETTFGRLYYGEVNELGALPDLEIAEVSLFDALPENLAYPLIQPVLLQRIIEFKQTKGE